MGDDGRPVVGAEVELLSGSAGSAETDALVASLFPGAAHPRRRLWGASAVEAPVRLGGARTGADGNFTIATSEEGEGVLVAWSRGEIGGPVPARPGIPQRVVVRSGSSLRGRVLDEVGGTPIADARILVAGPTPLSPVCVGPAGEFSIGALAEGEFRVTALAPGHGPASRIVRLRTGEDFDLEVRLPRGHRIVLRVEEFADEGASPPIPGARVVLLRESDGCFVSGRTDSGGEVVFESVPAGRYRARAEADGFLSWGIDDFRVPAADSGLIALERGVSTRVVVRDEDGRPVPGVEVWRALEDETWDPVRCRKVGVSDDRGSFDFCFDWSGSASVLYLVKPGYGVGVAESGSDSPLRGGEISCVLPRGSRLAGSVTETGGEPAAGVVISLRSTPSDRFCAGFTSRTVTDAAGDFAFEGVPVGSAQLVCADDRPAPSRVTIQVCRDSESVRACFVVPSR